MKTTSRFAMAAAAGVLVGGMAMTPAGAADLGGDCCLDLEERVAELEATTARKGNRVVSLEISGQVNRALLVWDDGVDSDAYVVDNAYSNTRFRFKGEGQITSGWKAGFLIEIQVNDAASSVVNNGGFLIPDGDDVFEVHGIRNTLDEGNGETAISTRHAAWHVDSERFGRLTVGHSSPATDDIILISIPNVGAFSGGDVLYNSGFVARGDGGLPADNDNFLSNLTWGDLAGNATSTRGFDGGLPGVSLDTNRGDFIRYDTPAIFGFILSAAWGEDDVWDVAARFTREWNSIRVAAGIGYYDNEEQDVNEVKGSASFMHVPSGLFLNVAALGRDDDSLGNDSNFWYVQIGIERRFLPYGATVFYGEYGKYNDFAAGALIHGLGLTVDDDWVVTGSDAKRWGLGVAQSFDSASFQLYAAFQYWEADIDAKPVVDPGSVPPPFTVGDVDDWWGVALGARIKF